MCWHKIDKTNTMTVTSVYADFFFQIWIIGSVVQSALGRELLYLTPTKSSGSMPRCFVVITEVSIMPQQMAFTPSLLCPYSYSWAFSEMKFGVTDEWRLSCFLFLCYCLSGNYSWTRGLNSVSTSFKFSFGIVLPDRWRSSRMRAEESSGHQAHAANWKPQEDSRMKKKSTVWCHVWLHVDDIQCWWWQKWLGSVISFQRGLFLLLQIRYVLWHTCSLRRK